MKGNKFIKVLLIFLTIFVPFRELIAMYTNSYVKFVPDILIWGLFVYVVFKNKFKLKLKIYDYFYLAFLIIGLISTFINHVSIISYILQFRSISTMYVLFVALRNIELNKSDYKPVVISLSIVSTILIFGSLVEFVTNKCYFFNLNWINSIEYYSNFERVYSALNNPNSYAAFIAFVMVTLIYLEKNKYFKIIPAFYVLGIVGIILSASRSTLLVCILAIVFLLIIVIKNKNFKSILKGIAIILCAFIIVFGLQHLKSNLNLTCSNNAKFHNFINTEKKIEGLNKANDSKEDKVTVKNTGEILSVTKRINETISGTTQKNSTANGRIYKVKLGIQIFKDYPALGTGFGTYGSAASRMIEPMLYEKYDIEKNFYADNDYIKIMVETGIIGTLLFAAFVISFLLDKYKKPYQLLMLLMFLVLGMFYNITELQVLCLILYLSLSMFERVDANE